MELFSLLNDPQWRAALHEEFDKPYMQKLEKFLLQELESGKTILPPKEHWFEALNTTPLSDVKVVILGQDPYPSIGHAHGLCFSVSPGVKPLPKSLINIYKELQEDCGIDNFHSGYLLPWARQGVLMLNAVLSVEAGRSNAHKGQGWEHFTDRVIETINRKRESVVFLLWGAQAQKKGERIERNRHKVISSAHPSPLSAYRGFWGSRPFSQINNYLKTTGQESIDWQL